MANYTLDDDQAGKHATLTAATVDTVTFDDMVRAVEVLNRTTGTDDIYFTVDGSTPTVGGTNTFVVTSARRSLRVVVHSHATVVKLISAGTPPYSVSRA